MAAPVSFSRWFGPLAFIGISRSALLVPDGQNNVETGPNHGAGDGTKTTAEEHEHVTTDRWRVS